MACRDGAVSLIIGSGISYPYGIPSWNALAEQMWLDAFPKAPSPWSADKGSSPLDLPQFLPIVFERVINRLGEKRFIERLTHFIYKDKIKKQLEANVLLRSDLSLAVIARLLRDQSKLGPRRQVVRVITPNVDDLLYEAVMKIYSRYPVILVARSSAIHHEWSNDTTIPIYHIHGLVPSVGLTGRPANRKRELGALRYQHRIVFTDSDYWKASMNATSFPNRIVGGALHDSHCVFVGLSMTDMNILRWLAVRRMEFVEDATEAAMRTGQDRERSAKGAVNALITRHFWVRPEADDPGGFLSSFLLERGVIAVPISGWCDDSFRRLIESCFPDARETKLN